MKRPLLSVLALTLAGPALAQQTLPRPEPGSGPLVFQGAELMRNGAFDFGGSAWATSGISGAHKAADRQGGGLGLRLQASQAMTGGRAIAAHKLALPTKLERARFKLALRLGATSPGGQLQGLAIDIGVFAPAGFQSLASIAAITPTNAPTQWRILERSLSAPELRAIEARLRAGGQVVFLARLFGDGIAADLDDISLVADGSTPLPKLPGSIAVVVAEEEGLALERVSPDGRGRVSLWRGGDELSRSYGLCWRPDGRALCFTSSHEAGASFFNADLYELSATGLRRISNAPSLAAMKRDPRPTGRVKVKVRNLTDQGVVAQVYVQGGRKVGGLTLGPRQRGEDIAELIIDDVVDLGPGVGQYVTVRVPRGASLAANTVDVIPGQTVALVGEASVSIAMAPYNASSPSYRPDGQRIAFSLGKLSAISPRGLLDSSTFGSLIGLSPAWGPDGRLAYLSPSFELMSYRPGDDRARTLIKKQGGGIIEDLAWLNKDRLVFTRAATVPGFNGQGTNLYLHALGSGQTRPLTEMLGEHWTSPSPSPDGQLLTAIRRWSGEREHRELWVLKLSAPRTSWRIPLKGQPIHCAWQPQASAGK